MHLSWSSGSIAGYVNDVSTDTEPAIDHHTDSTPSANSSGWGIPGRRASSHKSSHIDAPITKVINIILAAQENQPSYIIQALDKVNRLHFLALPLALGGGHFEDLRQS